VLENVRNDIVEVAVGGGRVLAAGNTAEIRALTGPGIREIELRGRSCSPASSMHTAT
jgi:predicted amidohydrolase YtcJ